MVVLWVSFLLPGPWGAKEGVSRLTAGLVGTAVCTLVMMLELLGSLALLAMVGWSKVLMST